MVMKTMRLLKGILFTFCGIIFCLNSHAALEHEKLVNYISLGEFSRETAEIALKKM
ncbi:TPA: alpha/beta hydrolase, partial [Legionella pneumophila]|nr:alpha/beta hydrolase [Legionella pneumophila]